MQSIIDIPFHSICQGQLGTSALIDSLMNGHSNHNKNGEDYSANNQ